MRASECKHCDSAKVVEQMLCKCVGLHTTCSCENVNNKCRGSARCLNIEALGTSFQKVIGPNMLGSNLLNAIPCNVNAVNILGMSCPSWQWHGTGYSWSQVQTRPVAPLWCDLGRCSQTVVVIKLLQTSAFNAQLAILKDGSLTPIFLHLVASLYAALLIHIK